MLRGFRRRHAAARLAVLLVLLVAPAREPVRAASAAPPRSVTAPGAVAGSVVTYRPPVVPLRVLRPFAPPAVRYGAGHLGVDLAADGVVRAAGAGVVTLAGPVAGRGVVVVLHPDGVRTEYEPVRAAVRRGQVVRAGDVLGVIAGAHAGCAGPCLHWGARRGDTYLDPLSLLRPLGPVRLVPLNG